MSSLSRRRRARGIPVGAEHDRVMDAASGFVQHVFRSLTSQRQRAVRRILYRDGNRLTLRIGLPPHGRIRCAVMDDEHRELFTVFDWLLPETSAPVPFPELVPVIYLPAPSAP